MKMAPLQFKFNSIQEDAYIALKKYQKKNKKGIVVMPTGSGKTFLAVKWVKDILKREPNARFLFMAHTIEILLQTKNKEFANNLKLKESDSALYFNKQKEIKQFTFATTQTLSRHLDKFKRNNFDYIIVDECHHSQSKSYRKILEHFNPKFLLGLTATPHRMDGLDITMVNGEIAFSESADTAIRQGVISNLEYWCVDNDIDFSNIRHNGNTYSEKDFNKKIGIKKYDEMILSEYNMQVKKHKRNKTIAFCATVKHAKRLCKFFSSKGIKSDYLVSRDITISDEKSYEKRKEVIDNFKNGDTEIIFVRDIFNEGVDVPNADCAMLLRPTQSHTIFSQQIGRVLRVSKNKKYALVLDFSGNAKRSETALHCLGSYANFDILKEIKQKKYHFDHNKELIIIKNNIKIRISRTKFDIIHKYFQNATRRLSDALSEFKNIYGDEKPRRSVLRDDHHWIYWHFRKNSLIDKYCKSSEKRTLDDAISVFNEKYGNRIPHTGELRKNDYWILRHFQENKIVSKYCTSQKMRKVEDAIIQYKKTYGDKKPTAKELIRDHSWIYRLFKKGKLLKKYCYKLRSYRTLKDAISQFEKIYGTQRQPYVKLRKENSWMCRHFEKHGILDKYCISRSDGRITLDDAIKEFKKIYGRKRPGRSELEQKNKRLYYKLHTNNLLDKYCKPSQNNPRTLKDAVKKLKKVYGKKKPNRTMLGKEHSWIHYHLRKNGLLEKYCSSKYKMKVSKINGNRFAILGRNE